MNYIPGSNNGASGFGMYRALYPKNLSGPFGHRNMPLPNAFAHPTALVSKPYRLFGSQVRLLTPGGATTSPSIGYNAFSRRKRRSHRRRSYKRKTKMSKHKRKSHKKSHKKRRSIK